MPTSSDNTGELILKECGFTEKERVVLSSLILYGQRTAGAVAKQTALKRSTVYSILEDLIEQGVATRRRKEGVSVFSSVDPELLPEVIARKVELSYQERRKGVKLLNDYLKEIRNNRSHDVGGFEVGTFETGESVHLQLQQVLLSGDFAGIFNPQLLLTKESRQVTEEFLIKTAVTKPKIREIAVAGPVTDWYRKKIKNKNHELRELDKSQQFLVDMILVKGSVVIAHYDPKRQAAIKIIQPEFFKSMMTVFEGLWQSI